MGELPRISCDRGLGWVSGIFSGVSRIGSFWSFVMESMIRCHMAEEKAT